MISREKAVATTLVDVEKDGEHEPGIIVSPKPTATGLVKVMLLSGAVVVRHCDRLSPRSEVKAP